MNNKPPKPANPPPTMNKIAWLLVFLIVFLATDTRAQVVTDDDESLAYQLKKKYPDERTACISSIEEYDFDIGKGEAGVPVVMAIMNKKVQFISLREASMQQYGEFYDKFSAINKFRQFYKSGKSFVPVRNKPQDKSATSGDIFYDDSRVQFFNIVMPKMGMGSMVEVEKKYFDMKYLARTLFSSDYPIKERVIRFKVPAWLQLDLREINFEGYKVEKSTETEGKKTVYTFRMKDLPAIPSEPNALSPLYTVPHLMVLLKSFEADGKQQQGFQTAADLYKWYNFLYKKADNQPATFKAKTDELVRGKNNELDKVKAIFYWVQDNIRYIAFEDGYAGFIPETAQDVYRNKFGDCKGMANLTTQMLKLAGLDAHMTWIGTKHLPYNYSIPSLGVDNHCISTVFVGGKNYFLDATEKYAPLGEYAYRIQGKEAMVGKGEQHQVIKVPVADKANNKILTQASFVLNDNILKGHLKVTFTGEERTHFHQYYQDLPTDRKKEILQRILEFGNSNLSAANIKTSDLSNREMPVVIEGDIDLSNNVIRDEKEVYAGIDFFPRKLNDYLPDNKRVSPYEFNSIYTAEDEIELNIPGYKVKDIPAAINHQSADYGFAGSYTQEGSKIILKKSLNINNGTVKTADFPNWRSFLKKLKDFNNNIVTVEKDATAAVPVAAAPAKTTITTPVKKAPVKRQQK